MKQIVSYFLFFSLVACSHSPTKESSVISDSKGRVVARYNEGKVFTYIYGKETDKIERSVTADTNSKTVFTIDYFYEDGRLSRAEKSNGEKIQLQYDSMDRIAKITTADDIIDVQYNSRLNKPALIKKADGSVIKVFYKSNGTIEKIEQSKGEM
jgi:hypothetical protein